MPAAPTEKPVKQPGPDHPITIERNSARVVVHAGGSVVAETTHALTLREADYQPVQYIPLQDVDRGSLRPTDHETYCPFKGDASYYTVAGVENAVWEYREPYAAVAQIKGHVAFYADRVQVSEEPADS